MGNKITINKINYEDTKYAIKNNYIIINTLATTEQEILIVNTISAENETQIINNLLKNKKFNEYIIIYGKNCNDYNVIKKYEQLITLGFTNVYLYIGGLFEWLLLQDIYGDDNFSTTKNILDILKYKSNRVFELKYLE
jgi:hypothetical protein